MEKIPVALLEQIINRAPPLLIRAGHDIAARFVKKKSDKRGRMHRAAFDSNIVPWSHEGSKVFNTVAVDDDCTR
jgi:hypothetical protein